MTCAAPLTVAFKSAAVFFAVLLFARIVVAGQPSDAEHQLKAAYLFNFTKFVDWPAAAFASADSPLVIGVLGDNALVSAVEQTIRGKKINGHAFEAHALTSDSDFKNCQVLFIGVAEKKRYPEIFKMLGNAPVLTIGESEDFLDAGGMINLVIVENKIRFQINAVAARSAQLTINAHLLTLAQSVKK